MKYKQRTLCVLIFLFCTITISHQVVWSSFEFSKQIDNTDWIESFEEAQKKGYTEQWVAKTRQLFNLDKVEEEIKSSRASNTSCKICKSLINLVRSWLKKGRNKDEILDFMVKLCISFKYFNTPRMCDGLIHITGYDMIDVIDQSPMTSDQICSFYLQYDCPNGYDKCHDWSVKILPSQKPACHPVKPPLETLPRLKVLQISDTHYDPNYQEGTNAECGESVCCHIDHGFPEKESARAGKWGDYRKCDTPMILFENALKHISNTHRDIDYILWTGDLPPHDDWNRTKEENVKNLKVSAALMAKYFKGIPIFPSVGNHESCPVDVFGPSYIPSKNMSWLYDQFDKEWSRWLSRSTSETIRSGAYYSDLVRPGLRIIALNGNYCHKQNFWLLMNSTDPVGMLSWLIHELDAAEAKGEKVHIIGHVPPGSTDCMKVWSRNFYNIVNRYEATIMAQFYGHTHQDEFEVFYDTGDFKRPINVAYISPSLTPWEFVNPAYRIYYVDGDHPQTTRVIVDHETWTMNLNETKDDDEPVWYKAYTARKAYNMASLLPKDWNDLIDRMAKDTDLFEVYHRNQYRNSPVRSQCDYNTCRKRLLCDARSGRSYDRDNLCQDLF